MEIESYAVALSDQSDPVLPPPGRHPAIVERSLIPLALEDISGSVKVIGCYEQVQIVVRPCFVRSVEPPGDRRTLEHERQYLPSLQLLRDVCQCRVEAEACGRVGQPCRSSIVGG